MKRIKKWHSEKMDKLLRRINPIVHALLYVVFAVALLNRDTHFLVASGLLIISDDIWRIRGKTEMMELELRCIVLSPEERNKS